MKSVTIYALHLGTGGTEKCISYLSNMINDEYKVKIISMYKLQEKPFFHFSENVEIKYLLKKLKPNREEWKASLKNKNIFKFAKESFLAVLTLTCGYCKLWFNMLTDKSDIIISTRTNFNKYVGFLAKKRIVKIAWEHNHHCGDKSKYTKCIKSVKRMNYYVLNSDDLYQFYKDKCNCSCVKIPNAIDDYPIKYSTLKEKRFVCVGRLSPEKGMLDLIDLFANINKEDNTYKLSIIGDGVEKDKIIKKVKEYNLEKKVTLHGFLSKDEINKIFLDSCMFLMTSYTESFGIVLIEAMSFGLPCVAYSSAQGARELIADNKNGYLIDNRDIGVATKKIVDLINDKPKMKKFSNNARLFASNYTTDNIKLLWLRLLEGKINN